MKVLILLIVCFVALVTSEEEASEKCPHVVLQDNVDLNKIKGDWRQMFYSKGSFYKDTICYHVHVDSINETAETMLLTYHFAEKKEKKGEIPQEFFEGNLEANVKPVDHDDDHDEESEGYHYIGNHIATDYENYLVLYACDATGPGERTVDVQVRNHIRKLGRIKKQEIGRYLSKIGMKMSDLVRVSKWKCPKDF